MIPLHYYSPVFYNLVLFLVLYAALGLVDNSLQSYRGVRQKHATVALMIFSTAYLGLRPISYVFGDMGTYNLHFERLKAGEEIFVNKDIGWTLFMRIVSSYVSGKTFFLLCAFLYVYPVYIAIKRLFIVDSYLLLLMVIASFSFWPAGTNGIRNGIATSIFILALSISTVGIRKIVLITIACLFHLSIVIPTLAFFLTLRVKNFKNVVSAWLASILLSLVIGNRFELFISSFDWQDERVGYLTQGNINNDLFSSSGFRWDFLIYSSTAVWVSYYFIVRKKFVDKLYRHIASVYVVSNAFWILVMRANFSNRFAYLSWFLMPLVIFYPFVTKDLQGKNRKTLGVLVLAYYSFTYGMFLLNR